MTSLFAAKKQMRQEMRQKRLALTPAEKAALDSQMCRQLLQSTLYQNCHQLFCFVSLPQEPQTTAILEHALRHGKCVAVPRCLPNHTMQFFTLRPETNWTEQLESGTYGVLEPLQNLAVALPDLSQQSLCLVPGLAFDRHGGRLGYGAGYYDRFFARYPQITKIGYAASQFVVADVPMEPTDQRLDGLATEYPLEVWNG